MTYRIVALGENLSHWSNDKFDLAEHHKKYKSFTRAIKHGLVQFMKEFYTGYYKGMPIPETVSCIEKLIADTEDFTSKKDWKDWRVEGTIECPSGKRCIVSFHIQKQH